MSSIISLTERLFGTFLILFLVQTCQAAYEIKLLHYLDDSNYSTERGVAEVHNVDTNDVTFRQHPLNPGDIKQLKTLAEKDAFYRMDIVIRQTNKKDIILSTFAKACSMVESKLHDSFNVYLDHNNNVVGVSLLPYENQCSGKHVTDADLAAFRSKMFFNAPENGPVPDTLSYIQKIEREREAREKGGPKDNRSFLQKYWMYLVPLAIFLAVSGVANPEAQSGGGGGGGAR
uniref:ER membrane protein complex subunit 10 n=1 Tax=Cacopsylla melanoneura TaxID=428564 RepID=A0A8D8R7D8_9HEMI